MGRATAWTGHARCTPAPFDLDQSRIWSAVAGCTHIVTSPEALTMKRIVRNPLRLFLLLNLCAGLLVLAGAFLAGTGGDSLRALEQWQTGGTHFRIALAALLYSLFAWYADLYFRPRPNRDM